MNNTIYTIRREPIQLPSIDRRHRPSIRNHPASSFQELMDQYWSIPDHDNEEVSRHSTEAEALAALGHLHCSSWESGNTVYGELYWIECWEVDEDGDLVDTVGAPTYADMET